MTHDASAADAIRAALEDTTNRQRKAADPETSAWVSANAGTGKTHVLTSRTLRLLLAGTAPERILCLTYTKAAAAEMSKRVFDRLSAWVTQSNADLESELSTLLGRTPKPAEHLCARVLFTRAIETPGGLKVQTIHAFCERLLQRFPIEAGVPPGFSTLDDDLGRALKKEAIGRTIAEALDDEPSPLAAALKTAVAYAIDDRFEDVLSAALADRQWLAGLAAAAGASNAQAEPLAEHAAMLCTILGVKSGRSVAGIEEEMASLLSDGQLAEAVRVLGSGSSTEKRTAESLAEARAATSRKGRINGLKGALLTKDGDARAKVATQAVRENEPGLHAALMAARDRLAELTHEELALKCVDATLALITLAGDSLRNYRAAKERRAALDFDDLIEKAVTLLTSSERGATDWVLYKLDGGIDHILVDESQDTSPQQWQIVEALAREFFSGEGAAEKRRTLFAVGDEKQSIYSFQGAAPEMFAKMGDAFRSLAEESLQRLEPVPLDLSFRTVAPVLEAVDRVFANPNRTPGLSWSRGKIKHAVKRLGESGLVEIWPTEKPTDSATANAFDPLGEHRAATPVERLAGRIADTIAGWIEDEEILRSKHRAIRPGDILILCRKRRPFAAPMVAALKARHIPVAGADRLVLTQQLAVQDLIALGDFVTLPDDDLTLAALLKSPLIGFDDDALFELAHQRKGSLWHALVDKRGTQPRYREAADRLVEWRRRADYLPPFEFFAKALEEDGLRKMLLARLGHEAADPIDEFLHLSIAYDDREAPSLTGFLSWLRETDREIKRDMEHGTDEVRVMTVHASKGLEAPIVFLPDTCSAASAGSGRDPLTQLRMAPHPKGSEPPRVWNIKGASKITAIRDARDDKRQKEQEELNRLLYVAMTRAEDRLYVCGFEGKKSRVEGCWYNTICDALAETMKTVGERDGREVLRFECGQSAAIKSADKRASSAVLPALPPEWASRKAPRVPQRMLPLAPSRLVPFETDPEGDPVPGPLVAAARDVPAEPSAPAPPADAAGRDRFLRGTLTHALFEHLPELPNHKRRTAAQFFLERRGAALAPIERENIVQEVLGILEDGTFAGLFGPRSRAEVAVAAELARPDGEAPSLKLSGSIDRLVEEKDAVLIVDYKTNHDVPASFEEIPEAYLLQLASYRLALKSIHPDRNVRAALLWTRVPRLLEIPVASLDVAESQLWELSKSSP